jgi:translation initiation factor IF-2
MEIKTLGEIMAKLRVHELARDLNMTNKVLLAKLNDMDISVKSHMSSLDGYSPTP